MFPIGELVFRAAESSVKELGTGAYAKNILVLALAEPNSPGNRSFIAKILSAASLDLSTDTLFAEIPAETPVNCFAALDNRPQFILVFGLSPTQLGLQAAVHPYQAIMCHDATWLFADALSVLEPDPVRKKKLWEALKPLFL